MHLKQLEVLIYVARHGTFKQAAEALYFDSSGEEFITPESIQYRIKQLEGELGVSLYRKRQGSARVQLTREGQLFLREALEVYQRMNEWKGMFLESQRGWLCFAATQSVILHRLTDIIAQFRKRAPGVRLRILDAPASEMERMVLEGRIDFALSTRRPEDPDLDYVLWKRSGMVVLVPQNHPLAKSKGVHLSEVAEFPLIALEQEVRGDRESLDEAFRRAGVKQPRVVMETTNSEIIANFVEAELGIAIVAESIMERQRRKIKAIPLLDPIGNTEVGLLVREGQFIPQAARLFIELLDDSFAKWFEEREDRIAALTLGGSNGSGAKRRRKKLTEKSAEENGA